MTNNENPVDWSTKINSIEKRDETKNTWNTMFRKIQNQVSERDQWTTRFNSIGTESADNMGQSTWKFQIPKHLTNTSLKSDWNTTINQTTGSAEEGTCKNKLAQMLLQCDDRQTHWNSKLLDIRKNEADANLWDTSFKEIAPPEAKDTEAWSSTFYAISEKRDLPEHWNTTFTKIEHPVDENSWSVKIEDIPDNLRQSSDWTTGFSTIRNHESNALWDTLFNGITRDDAENTPWTSEFVEPDITDITREGWATNLNPINKAQADWEMSVNSIHTHPVNNPIDKG